MMSTNLPSVSQKLDHFARFIALLVGQLDVRVVAASDTPPPPNAVVLPALDGLDAASIDVLYGLCLREAGFLARSRKSVHAVNQLRTQLELCAAMMVESARIEAYLTRKFAGASEILDEHFSQHVRDERFKAVVLGVDPAVASSDEVFVCALKWYLLGCPQWGWEEFFSPQDWAAACAVLDTPALTAVLEMPLRKFDDSVVLARAALAQWQVATSTEDTTPHRTTTPQQNVWEKAFEQASTTLTAAANAAQERINSSKEEVQELQNRLAHATDALAPQADVVRNQLAALQKKATAGKNVSEHIRELGKLETQHGKIKQEVEKSSAKRQKWEDKIQTLADPDELSQHTQQRVDAVREKHKAAEQKEQKQEQRLRNALNAAQMREFDLTQKIDDPKASAAQKEKWEQHLAATAARIEELQENLAAHEEKSAQHLQDLSERLAQKERAGQQRLEQHARTAQETDDKLFAAKKKEQDLLCEQQQLQHAMDKVRQNIAKHIPAHQNIDDVVEEMQQLADQMEEMQQQLDEWEEPLDNLRNDIKNKKSALQKMQRAAHWDVEQQARALEETLKGAGIDLQLTEQMVEMEGWDAANTAQREFDKKASNQLEMSVINGCGGGRGQRDVMAVVNDLTTAIAEVDPSTIFADVAKLSPLSGFCASSCATSAQQVATKTTRTSSMTYAPNPHTVWSRQYDRVLPASVRSAKLVAQLRVQYKSEIAQIKNLFQHHLKPSFKPKFVGGKEEGGLDARNIWKLAAQQGDDYFEVIHKRPHHKAAATILVDLSGSCAAWGEDSDNADPGQALALMLSEGLTAANIPHEILGYCAPVEERLLDASIPVAFNRKSCRLETVVAKSFKDNDLSGLASLTIQAADNSDGESLRLATERLVKQNGQRKMLFMICDGKPFMNDADAAILDADLRQALEEAAHKNVVVSCLGLSHNHGALDDAYISMDTPSDLPNVVKKILHTP